LLKNALAYMRETRKDRYFPVPAELVAECEAAVRRMHVVKAVDEMTAKMKRQLAPIDEWSEVRQRDADKLIVCEMGRRAVREGWIGALWSYCRKCGRLPEMVQQIKECQQEQRDFEEGMRIAEGMKGDRLKLGQQLMHTGAMMRARAKEKAMIVANALP